MASPEIALWFEPGEPVLRGRVVKGVTSVVVDWDTGRRSTVKRTDPHVRFAQESSRRLKWLTEPGLLDRQLEQDPVSAIVDVIRDEGKPIQTATIKRRLVEAGVSRSRADTIVVQAKPVLAANYHLIIKGASHRWSDVPVDPHAGLRGLPPHDALDRLLETPRLKPAEKFALADAIRRALPPRGYH